MSDYLYFPPTPAQFGSSRPLSRCEHTGMIVCPWKNSEIATMRCVDLQKRCGMADNCRAKPNAQELADLTRAMAEIGKLDSVSARGEGAAPKRRNAHYKETIRTHRFGLCACGKPACYKQTRECMNCYSLRKYRPSRPSAG